MPTDERRLRKVTLRLYAADMDVLQEYFIRAGYTRAIRELVHRFVRQLEERANQQATLGQEDPMDIAIEEEPDEPGTV